MLVNRFVLSFILMIVGYIIVWKADWFMYNVGTIPFAEKFMRTEGGSRLFYKFLGVLFLLVGMLHLTGLLNPLMRWIVIRLFGFGQF